MCCALVMWPEASISDSLVSLNAAGGPPSFKFVPGMMRGFGGGLQARRQKRRPGSDRLSHQSESDRTRSLLSQVRVRPDPIAPLTSPSQAGSDRPSLQSESGRIRSPLSPVRVRLDPIAPLTSPSQAGSDRPILKNWRESERKRLREEGEKRDWVSAGGRQEERDRANERESVNGRDRVTE